MRVFTIGFTKKKAQQFFELLKSAGATHILDVRLNNVSQLSGFAKRDDLRWFLDKICHMGYRHMAELAPTKDILDGYKKRIIDWDEYERRFLDLMAERQIEKKIAPELLDGACLLCSEDKPHHCHRRLVAEYLSEHWGDVKISHLPNDATRTESHKARNGA